MAKYLVLILAALPVFAQGTFTAGEAVAMALGGHPALRAAGHATDEERGAALQAGLPPNPEVEAGVEAFRSGDDHELLVGVSQTLPVSGARRAARRAALLGVDAAERQAGALQKELAAEVRRLFHETLAAGERVRLAEAARADAEETARLMRVRHEKGDAPEMDAMRADAEHGRRRADAARAGRTRESLRARLAELCGVMPDALPECAGALAPAPEEVPEAEVLRARLEATPRHAARVLREGQAKTETEAARRAGFPEPTLRAGLRRDNASGTNSLDFGVGIALPLFDRNQGTVAAARARAQRLAAENESALRGELRRAMELRGEAASALDAAARLRGEVIPRYQEVCAAAEKALEIGGATLFELIAARDEFNRARMELLECEAAARAALVELEALL
ncbi:MAG: TolC family protein [Candidatus Hydrogenedens sp.]|nr:TolC family protein [Candidatus Hydrogenedentota bacterium]NLF56247.1 TolC family protein [Candidatus Hydrogenedens sp.]